MNHIDNHRFTWWSDLEEDYWKDIKMKLESYEDDELTPYLHSHWSINELPEEPDDWPYRS